MSDDPREQLKRDAAETASTFVRDGMVVGLGTGSTAKLMIIALGKRVQSGLSIKGVATSQETADQARKHGISLLSDETIWNIDLAIDGADQVDPSFNLIKGGGGALLKEKIVARAAQELIIMVDQSKQVPVLGQPFSLPAEVIPFGWQQTAAHIHSLGFTSTRRNHNGTPFVTESGHFILDLSITQIDNPKECEAALTLIPGVVETGLFVGMTSKLIVGTHQGIHIHDVKAHR